MAHARARIGNRATLLALAVALAACGSSHPVDAGGDLGVDASADAPLSTVDAALHDAAVDASMCRPRPVGIDCAAVGFVSDGGCQTRYECFGTLRDDGGSYRSCNTGTACDADTDCECLEESCFSGICWY